ncbi:hypothetical protein HOD19_03795 [bacterium]|jgi:hypothetical protein|nr:hypothetical protein [bacterium]MBT4648936.1 hypothetical protein [bacterium]
MAAGQGKKVVKKKVVTRKPTNRKVVVSSIKTKSSLNKQQIKSLCRNTTCPASGSCFQTRELDGSNNFPRITCTGKLSLEYDGNGAAIVSRRDKKQPTSWCMSTVSQQQLRRVFSRPNIDWQLSFDDKD